MPGSQTDERLLAAFRRASQMPWYRTLLDEAGVDPGDVADAASFARLCPPLTKANTFDRFSIAELAAGTSIVDLAGVLTSSGHGGRFSFGLQTKAQAASGAEMIDWVLDDAFQIKSQSTLAVNCLPMGVVFSSARMTVATTSVREDMAVALVTAFGPAYEQVLLVTDPLFMKRLLDYAAAKGTDWSAHRVQVVIGEETFGERFREYVASRLHLDLDHPELGYIASSFGVGELGLHLCFETPATIGLRRAAAAHPDCAQELFGSSGVTTPLPMVFTYHPARTFIEVADADPAGYGRLTISMLDTELPIPLLRYQTGDMVRRLDPEAAGKALQQWGLSVPGDLPEPLLALEGRDRERLPDGSHVAIYKDALYTDHEIAHELTGAFRVAVSGERSTLHVQRTAASAGGSVLERRLLEILPAAARPDALVLWPYERFPYGMSVDYERKFAYYVPEP